MGRPCDAEYNKPRGPLANVNLESALQTARQESEDAEDPQHSKLARFHQSSEFHEHDSRLEQVADQQGHGLLAFLFEKAQAGAHVLIVGLQADWGLVEESDRLR